MSPDDLTATVVEIDGRDMQPPEPLERTLTALDGLPERGEVLLQVYCHPRPLFDILGRNGYVWQEQVHPDGTHAIRIRRAADGAFDAAP